VLRENLLCCLSAIWIPLLLDGVAIPQAFVFVLHHRSLSKATMLSDQKPRSVLSGTEGQFCGPVEIFLQS